MLKKNGVIPHIQITRAENSGYDINGSDRATNKTHPKEVGLSNGPQAQSSRQIVDSQLKGADSLDRALVADIEQNVEKFREGEDSTLTKGFSEPGEDEETEDESKVLEKLSPTTSSTVAKILSEHERKIGHRRVDEEGKVTYKRVTSSQLLKSIQLGLNHAIGGLSSKPQRDVLMQDFTMIELVTFPREGSSTTAAHDFSDFRFKTYAPVAFRYFRELFGIKTDDFLVSLCGQPPRELSNPGASGSVFFVTCDDEFILKTLQRKEASFLEKLLPGYYMNLNQNPRTLLPKFFGLYCYQSGGKNIRLIVMNNLIPSSIKIHEKYDLKGSTFKRKASKYERLKATPTYKDLDFLEIHPEGLMLEPDTYDALIKTLKRDCLVLESFKIMDYSFLMGIHNLDLTLREKKLHLKEKEARKLSEQLESTHRPDDMKESTDSSIMDNAEKNGEKAINANNPSDKKIFNRNRSIKRVTAYSTAMESIQAESEPIDLEEQDAPPGGIPARNAQGERLLCFIGIIDILQCYELKKKLEHTFKSIFHDGDTVSVHRPSFYAQRFKDFVCNRVFRKVPSPTIRSTPFQDNATSSQSTKSHIPFYSHKMATAALPILQAPILEPLPEEDINTPSLDNISKIVPHPYPKIATEVSKPNLRQSLPLNGTRSNAINNYEKRKAGSFNIGPSAIVSEYKSVAGGDSVSAHSSIHDSQKRNFYTSTPGRSDITLPSDKAVPISTYKFPPLTWNPQPSDLSLIDDYGLFYDPEIERDIGRELFAKAQLENSYALHPIPPLKTTPTPNSLTLMGLRRLPSSLDRRKNLSREQFFSQANTPTEPSNGPSIDRLGLALSSSKFQGSSTPATPVTIQFRRPGSTSIPTQRRLTNLNPNDTGSMHPPSPPRDYDDTSSDDGTNNSIQYHSSRPPAINFTVQTPRTRITSHRSPSMYGTTSPVHPASHSTTPITVPSERLGNRSSLSNLIGPSTNYNANAFKTLDRSKPLNYVKSTNLDRGRPDKYASNYIPQNNAVANENYDVNSRQYNLDKQFVSGRSLGLSREAKEKKIDDLEDKEETLKRRAISIKTSDSRNSMLSSISFNSTGNDHINGNATMTTTDYATACEDTCGGSSGSFSTPDSTSFPSFNGPDGSLKEFDNTYVNRTEAGTPDTVILNSDGPTMPGDRPKYVFRDYHFKERTVKVVNSSRNSSRINTTMHERDNEKGQVANRLASYQLLEDNDVPSPSSSSTHYNSEFVSDRASSKNQIPKYRR